MDLDFEFEDPLLEYSHLRPIGSTVKYLVSSYLVNALQKHILKPSGAVCEWNPSCFAPCLCVDTLLGFISDNSAIPAPFNLPGYVISGQTQDPVLYYHFNDCRKPSTFFNTLTLYITYRFNEIHKISTNFGINVSRPEDILWDEIGWTEEQKYSQDPSFDAGYN